MTYAKIFTSALFLLLSLAPLGLHAQMQDHITGDEKAVFAYLKLSKQNEPDFEPWIKHSPLYKKTARTFQNDILDAEKERLTAGFEAYKTAEKDEKLLKVKRDVTLFTNKGKDGKPRLNFQFPDGQDLEIPYFPYPYGEDSIALIVDDLKKFASVKLGAQQHKTVKEYFFDEAPYTGVLEMKIRPVSADSSAAMEIDGQNRWLMLGEIESLTFRYYDRYKQINAVLWEYKASES